jgi:hypothetical protein
MDQHAVDDRGHADQMQQRHDDRDGHRLQGRLDPLAEGHEEQRIAERKQQSARDIGAEDRDDRALQHQYQPQLPREIDRGRVAHQPPCPADRDQRQPRPPADRPQLRERATPLPHQPGDHRGDEQTVAEGRAGPPDRRQIGDVAAEQREQQDRRDAEREQMPGPGRRGAIDHDGDRLPSTPNSASSGASRASQP